MDKITLLKELTMLDGAPGFEYEIKNYMRNKFEELGFDYIQDNLGGIFAHKPSKNPDAPTVLIAGHQDEVGFMITSITKHGLLKFTPLGGWWSQVLLSTNVTVTAHDGKKFKGVISATPPHLLSPEEIAKPIQIKNMLIDCGFEDEEDAKKHVKVGDFATPFCEFEKLSDNRYMGKAFDNRYGCAITIDLLNELKDKELDVNLYIGASVQEEVGLRGATVAASLINPDFFIAVDASPSRDTSGDMDELGRLGKGFLVRFVDGVMIHNPAVKEYIINLAKKNKVDCQLYTSPGGTDAGAVHISNNGVLSTVIGIPARNIHSSTGIIDIRDYDSAKEIIIHMLNDMDRNKLEEIKGAK